MRPIHSQRSSVRALDRNIRHPRGPARFSSLRPTRTPFPSSRMRLSPLHTAKTQAVLLARITRTHTKKLEAPSLLSPFTQTYFHPPHFTSSSTDRMCHMRITTFKCGHPRTDHVYCQSRKEGKPCLGLTTTQNWSPYLCAGCDDVLP